TVRLWDLESGKELHRFEGHKDVVSQVLWLPDACHALSCSWDTTVRLGRPPALPPAHETGWTEKAAPAGHCVGPAGAPAAPPARDADRRRLAATPRPVSAPAARLDDAGRGGFVRRRRSDPGSPARGLPRGRRVRAARSGGLPVLAANHPQPPRPQLFPRRPAP